MVLLSKGRLTLSVVLAVLSSIDVHLHLPERISIFILNGVSNVQVQFLHDIPCSDQWIQPSKLSLDHETHHNTAEHCGDNLESPCLYAGWVESNELRLSVPKDIDH